MRGKGNNCLLGNIKFIIHESMLKYKIPILIFSSAIIITNLYSTIYKRILSKIIIDAFVDNASLFNICIIVGIIFIAAIICKTLNSYLNSKFDVLQTQISNLFVENRIHKAMTIKYELLDHKEVLDMMDKAEDATLGGQNCVKVTLNCFLKTISYLTVILMSAYLFAAVGIIIPLILAVTSVIHFIIINYFKKKDKKNVWDNMPPIDRRLGYLERISSQFAFGKEIRIFSLADWIANKIKSVHNEKFNMQKKSQKYWLTSSLIDSVVIFFQQTAMYAVLIYYYLKGQIQIGDLSMYIGLCIVVYSSLLGILDNIAELKNTSILVDDYRCFMGISDTADITDNERKMRPDYIMAQNVKVEFRNVSFKYPGSEQYSLKNINITIEPQNRLAVVGANGAGKSTFIKLLCGLYAPTEGEILINGCNILSISKKNYHKIISSVFQNVNMFALSLKENAALGYDDIDDEKVIKCLKQAGLYEKVSDMPNGINTELTKIFSDDGVDLSGGEKQKLAIARALYKDSKIVILDEPTAALDALAEKALYESFDNITKDKTAVFVSHRLSSTKFCDDILFFENGEIIEQGSHEKLMLKNGKYTEMFAKQAYYYKI